MTHSLHRHGKEKDLKEDFVLMFLLSKIIPQGTYDTMKQIWEILAGYEQDLVNYGNHHPNWGGGPLYRMEDLKKADNSRMIMAVFKDRKALTACLNELKERNLGISVLVSGLYNETGKTCAEIGLKPHTVNLSLGIHGNTGRLPGENQLEIQTMCGHAMVSSHLILHLIKEIEAGAVTCREAAEEMARMCDCGIFNTYRAEKILKRITASSHSR
ncbi:MAG: hypothetical protein AB1427_08900 [Thermodesulfobacteriota bacterium]